MVLYGVWVVYGLVTQLVWLYSSAYMQSIVLHSNISYIIITFQFSRINKVHKSGGNGGSLN